MTRVRQTALLLILLASCAPARVSHEATPVTAPGATVARVYYWRAKPGKLADLADALARAGERLEQGRA